MTTLALKIAERAIGSYVLAFLLLTLGSGFDYTDISAVKAAAISAIPAGVSVVVGYLKSFVGDPADPSLVSGVRKA